MESILTSVKKMLGIEAQYNHFDEDIVMHINSAFFVLHQLGVGPDTAFKIDDNSAVWTDFIDAGEVESVKSYVFMYVKRLFDPPSNSSHLAALKEDMKELEWRMNVAVDPGDEDV